MLRKATVFSIRTTLAEDEKGGSIRFDFTTPVAGRWTATGGLFEDASGTWANLPAPNTVSLIGKKNKATILMLTPATVRVSNSGTIKGDLIREGEILDWTCTSVQE